jgi:chromosome segregation ATPase
VRSFAAETEREIAELQRQLHDARSQLAELSTERERLTTAEYARSEEPTSPLGFNSADTARYRDPAIDELVQRTAELEQRLRELQRENARLRDQLEGRL